MTRLTSRLLVVTVLMAAPGCRTLMDTTPEKPIQAPPLKVTQQGKPVQPDEVTPANARAKAQQLLDEMELDVGRSK